MGERGADCAQRSHLDHQDMFLIYHNPSDATIQYIALTQYFRQQGFCRWIAPTSFVFIKKIFIHYIPSIFCYPFSTLIFSPFLYMLSALLSNISFLKIYIIYFLCLKLFWLRWTAQEVTLSLSLFMCCSVRPLFFLLVSLEFFLVPKSFNAVSRKFKRCLKFQGCFNEVTGMFHGSFRGFCRKLMGVSKKLKRRF